MQWESLTEIRARAVAGCRRAHAIFNKLPLSARRGLVIAATALVLLGGYSTWSSANKDALLHLKVQHNFRSAEINVQLDGDEIYSGKMYGTARKKLGIFSDGVQGSMSQSIPVAAGKHQISVRVAADDGTSHEDSIIGEFSHHNTRELAISARHSDLNLTWQGTGTISSSNVAAPAGAPESSPGWLNRYGSTVLLSIVGSFVSALTGFAIRELPNRIRTQQTVVAEEKPAARSAAAGR